MHDWKISVKNGEVQKPDNGCVKTFHVEIEDGNVYIVL
jgi:nitrite reductase (NADH) small subunit